jgi:Na+/melibiose symporter-like transporter
MVSFRFVGAAFEGLMALIGQEELVSGRLSVVWQIVTYIPYIAGALASGYISSHLAPRSTFVIVAVVAAGLALIGLWKPRAVFSHAYDKPQARATTFTADVARLVRHRAIYAPVLMMFLWSFAPGANTPLQFYLTNTLHASDAVYSYYNAVFVASFIPTMVLYGYLCKRVPLEKLLWWGAAIAVPQMIPLLFIHSGNLAIAMAVPIGLLGGVITVGIYDLSMRSCPSGLQGTMMMLVEGALFAASRGGDVLGSKIYGSSPTNGFLYCVIATTIVYALILPLILLVPKQLMATTDGEAIPAPA